MFSKFTPSLCALLLLYQSLTAQTCTSVSTGDWQNNDRWNCSPFPDTGWSGYTTLVLDHNITISGSGSNKVIDLSGTTTLTEITIKAGTTLTFENNTQLILPTNAIIVLEEGAIIQGPSNSSNTLIKIGNNEIWGKCDGCTNEPLEGLAFIDEVDGYTPGPLPIELLYFKGQASEGGIELEWATASEKNFDYFSIERSSDARSFSPITEIKGQGESTIPVYYDYTDKHVVSGLMYYRLKAVDFDGSTEYFNVIAVYVPPAKHSIQIYPNPVQEKKFTIEINMESSEQVDMLLQDLSGKTLFQQKLNQGFNEVTLKSKIKSGVYVLVVRRGQVSHSQLLMLE